MTAIEKQHIRLGHLSVYSSCAVMETVRLKGQIRGGVPVNVLSTWEVPWVPAVDKQPVANHITSLFEKHDPFTLSELFVLESLYSSETSLMPCFSVNLTGNLLHRYSLLLIMWITVYVCKRPLIWFKLKTDVDVEVACHGWLMPGLVSLWKLVNLCHLIQLQETSYYHAVSVEKLIAK